MNRILSRTFLLACLTAALAQPAWADEMPMATHPGAKATHAETSPFLAARIEPSLVGLAAPRDIPSKQALEKDARPNQIGLSRRAELEALPAEARQLQWNANASGGYVARLRVRSDGALRLRVALALTDIPDGIELRVASTGGSAPPMLLGAQWLRETYGSSAGLVWTPVTSGESQDIEIFVPGSTPPSATRLSLADVSHLFVDPLSGESSQGGAKVLTCHLNFSCSTDPNIVNSGRAVAKMVITEPGGSSFLCTGSLLNDMGGVQRYFATAYHCIHSAAEASSLQVIWSYELACTGGTVNAGTTSLGSQLLRADKQNDFTLVQLTGSIPAGTLLLGWSTTSLAGGNPVYGIHHPAGIPKAYSLGTSNGKITSSALLESGEVLTVNALRINWQSGVTEPGSSGSPLMTGSGVVRGTLSMVPRNQTCTTSREAYYSDFALAYPLVKQYLSPSAGTADDFPDSAALASGQTAYDNAFLKVQLSSASDQDWFKFTFPQAGVWILYTSDEPGQATVDTVGRIYGSDGTTLLRENDDDPSGVFGTNFFFALHVLSPGTFYVQVTGLNGATGRFELNSIYDPDDDHSDLAFLGTALAVGQTLSGRIDTSGDGDYFIVDIAQAGMYTFSSTGATDVVGILRNTSLATVTMNDDASATNTNFRMSANLAAGRYYLQVIGYDVTTLGPYSVTAAPASTAGVNYTGLWWNPLESGWGMNTNHQGDFVFATLFTFAADGQAMWLSAAMQLQPDGSYSGDLFRSTGTPYGQVPFVGSTANNVGRMTMRFSSATRATLQYTVSGVSVQKSVEQQVFASPVPACSFTTASRAGEANYQDLWWIPAESGWGINFTHQGNVIFGTLFIYSGTGRDVWFSSPMFRQPDGSYSGTLGVNNGPPFNANPWTAVQFTPLGTMTVRFTSGDRATLSYTAQGNTVTKNIQRQVFGSTQPVCR